MMTGEIIQPNESFVYESEESLETFSSPMLTPVFVVISKENPDVMTTNHAVISSPNVIQRRETSGEWYNQPSLRSKMLEADGQPPTRQPVQTVAKSRGKTVFCTLV